MMAERKGFEPSVLAYTDVPGLHHRPLGHLSTVEDCNYIVLYLDCLEIYKFFTALLCEHFLLSFFWIRQFFFVALFKYFDTLSLRIYYEKCFLSPLCR